jgi:predicted ATPase
MSYPYRVMPDVKLSHNAALLLRTSRRRNSDGLDILDGTEAALADQRLAGKSFPLARAKNHGARQFYAMHGATNSAPLEQGNRH